VGDIVGTMPLLLEAGLGIRRRRLSAVWWSARVNAATFAFAALHKTPNKLASHLTTLLGKGLLLDWAPAWWTKWQEKASSKACADGTELADYVDGNNNLLVISPLGASFLIRPGWRRGGTRELMHVTRRHGDWPSCRQGRHVTCHATWHGNVHATWHGNVLPVCFRQQEACRLDCVPPVCHICQSASSHSALGVVAYWWELGVAKRCDPEMPACAASRTALRHHLCTTTSLDPTGWRSLRPTSLQLTYYWAIEATVFAAH
jgi:hypothetical protein